MAVKLVTDSTCDLPKEWLAKWDIAVMPAYINFGTESYPDDGVSIKPADLYRKLVSTPATTSAPSLGLTEQLIRDQLAKAEQVVVFTLTSKLSSIYNVARLAAQSVDPKRVTVVDSGQVSVGLGWMVAAAAEAAEQGASVDEISAAAMNVRNRLRLVFIVETLEYLKRSGRVNPLVASVGTLLQIKPIIEVVNGEVITVQRVRTMRKAIDALVDLAHQQAPLERLAVGGTNNPAVVQDLRQRVADIAPPGTIEVELTPGLGVHTGPGLLGFGSIRKAK